MIGYADGDARRLLNFLEQINATATGGVTDIAADYVANALFAVSVA